MKKVIKIILIGIMILCLVGCSASIVNENKKPNLKELNIPCEEIVNEFFDSMTNKDFDKMNKLVTDHLKITNKDAKEYMEKTLIYAKALNISEIERYKFNNLDAVKLKVKYEIEYTEDFIPTGDHGPGLNVKEKFMNIVNENGKWLIESWGY